ncbi:MAG: ATP-binding cassette domain-containing protein [Alicyclobacillus sp.]|nr:ATP-binding cassette domain-containing protein [Alicyclobacillus sp.]
MWAVEMHDVTYTYPEAEQPALVDVQLQVPEGAWVLLQGPTGSGKSTLLKCLTGACPEFYGGRLAGRVTVAGFDTAAWSPAQRAAAIGYVAQDPEAVAVYDVVEREVAFALENLGVPRSEMAWRVAEALEMVGLSAHARDSVETLSGGARQRLALAGALVHQPRVLLLDEPASQLDPVAADELLDCLQRLHQDFGLTLLIAEHRLDALYPRVDTVAYLEAGRIRKTAPPQEMAEWLREERPDQVPLLARLFPEHAPVLTVHAVRQRLAEAVSPRPTAAAEAAEAAEAAAPRSATDAAGFAGAEPIRTERVRVHYRGARDAALDRLTATIARNRLTAVIGPNGSGKTTLLRVLAGLQPPDGGRVVWPGRAGGRLRVGYLPQKPSDLFSQLTIRDELAYGLELQGVPRRDAAARVADAALRFDLTSQMERSPRDVSGGEQVRVAIASLWLTSPDILLLDEPTRGLDAAQKRGLGEMLAGLEGVTVVLVTHDLEFVAEHAGQVLFLYRGEVVLSGAPKQVFDKALAFAPLFARAFRGVDPSVHCLSDAVRAGWGR